MREWRGRGGESISTRVGNDGKTVPAAASISSAFVGDASHFVLLVVVCTIYYRIEKYWNLKGRCRGALPTVSENKRSDWIEVTRTHGAVRTATFKLKLPLGKRAVLKRTT